MKKFCKIGLNIVFLFLIGEAQGQIKHWVTLVDKGSADLYAQQYVSERTYRQRAMLGLPMAQASDVPLYAPYLATLEAAGYTPLIASKWLNAVSMQLSPAEADRVRQFPFVQSVVPFQGRWQLASSSPSDEFRMAEVLQQIHGEAFLNQGVRGTGVPVGIVDAGFVRAQENQYLGHAFTEQKVAAWKDWQTPDRTDPYHNGETFLDWHGTAVWQMVAGYDTAIQTYMGLAPDAQFYLARTEHGQKEYHGEQDLWIAAMEWMDSLGVRLVNSSLGYSRGMDDPEENYSPDEMDGRTVIAQGVKAAVEDKGMILVISAGNDGNDLTWQYLSTPAEVEEVISVGATRYSVWTKAGYSGIGPPYLDFVKPNISVHSTSGTSFAAPVITGLVAGMLQLDSTLSAAEIQELLQQSSHLAQLPNNYVGYGVPQCDRIYAALTGDSIPAPLPCATQRSEPGADSVALQLDTLGFDPEGDLLVYHLKADRRTVRYEWGYGADDWEPAMAIRKPSSDVHYSHLSNREGVCYLIEWQRQDQAEPQE